MNIKSLGKKALGFCKKHSTPIITTLVAGGIVATIIQTAKDTPAVNLVIENKTIEKGEELTKVEKVKVYAKGYWKTAVIALATILLVVGGCIFKDKQYISAVAACTAVTKELSTFKEAAKEVVGDKKMEEVRQAVIDKKIEEAEEKDDEWIETGKGTTKFIEAYTGQKFYSDMDYIRKAALDYEKMIKRNGSASINEWLWLLGLRECKLGEALGYSYAETSEMEVVPEAKLNKKGVAVTWVAFDSMPYVDYDSYYDV